MIIEPFPRSRSVFARLFGNSAFVKRVIQRLHDASISPAIVLANDHTEGLLALALAEKSDARSVMFLRSSGMEARDYYKYKCAHFDALIAVGEALQEKAQRWHAPKPVALIHDGINEDEFLPPKSTPQLPRRVLVIGNSRESKGWGDFADALELLASAGMVLPEFSLTGKISDKSYTAKISASGARCFFLSHHNDFRALVREHDLVINPSQRESFGMAAIEVLAAGVPLLSSRTGVIEQVQRSPEMLFTAGDPLALATALKNLLLRWGEIDFGVADAQTRIRERFLVGHSAAKLDAAYRALLERS